MRLATGSIDRRDVARRRRAGAPSSPWSSMEHRCGGHRHSSFRSAGGNGALWRSQVDVPGWSPCARTASTRSGGWSCGCPRRRCPSDTFGEPRWSPLLEDGPPGRAGRSGADPILEVPGDVAAVVTRTRARPCRSRKNRLIEASSESTVGGGCWRSSCPVRDRANPHEFRRYPPAPRRGRTAAAGQEPELGSGRWSWWLASSLVALERGPPD